MANNLIQVKRTSVSGRAPNTSILHTGELALNMADGILYSSNGSSVFEIGANNTNVNITGNLVSNNITFININSTNGFSANSSGSYFNSSILASNAYNRDVYASNAYSSQTFTSNAYLIANFTPSTGSGVYTSNSYIQNTFTSNAYIQSNYSPSTGSSVYASNAYVVSTFGSNAYNLTTYGSNAYVAATFGSNAYNSNTYSSIAYVSAVFGSNSYNQAFFAPNTGSTVYSSNSYVTATFGSNAYNQVAYGSNAYNSNTYGSNNYNKAVYGSNAYNQSTFAPITGSLIYASNAYLQSTYTSNSYLISNYAPITGSAIYSSNAYNQSTYTSNSYITNNYLEGGVSTTSDTQVLFKDGSFVNSSAGFTFNKSSNTLNVGGSVYIAGNIYITGNVTTFAANNLSITDNMIYLNSNSAYANPDLGFAAAYNDGVYHHAGFFRDHATGIWKVFENYLPEPQASQYIDQSNGTFRYANFQANTLYANSINANNLLGTAGQLLTANSTGGIYWSTLATTVSSGTSQQYTGDGSTSFVTLSNAFTLTNSNDAIVVVNGLIQEPGYHYTSNTTAIIFNYTPRLGDLIEVRTFAGGRQGVTGYTGSIGINGYTGSVGAGYTGSAGSSASMQIVNDPGYLVNNYSTNITSSYDGQVIYYPSNTVNGQVVTLISNTSGGLTTGQSITVYNASTNTISVANSTSTTLTQVITGAGGFRTLSAYGICTIICVANNNFVISGGGVY